MIQLKLFCLMILGLFLVSCSKEYLKKVLKDNPDILVEAIEQNPKEVMEALNSASLKFRQQQVAEAQKQRQAQREAECKNPTKIPETPKDRVYFGDASASLTIVEYSDFQCFYCKAVHDESLGQVLEEYKGKVRILYKHLPILQIHPQAQLAAQYYEAVGKVDKSKAKMFHDKLFAQQGEIKKGAKFLDQAVLDLGLSLKKVKTELDGVKSIIEQDMAEARKFGFQGTPGFLVGGVTLRGKNPFSEFKSAIDCRLEAMGEKDKESS